jgi:hypothetical protein
MISIRPEGLEKVTLTWSKTGFPPLTKPCALMLKSATAFPRRTSALANWVPGGTGGGPASNHPETNPISSTTGSGMR